MPVPLGPVMKAWPIAAAAGFQSRRPTPCPASLMPKAPLSSTAQSAKVSHARPIGAGDESMAERVQR